MDPVPAGSVLLRPLTRDDVAALSQLALDQGRNTSRADIERFLALEGARGFALVRDGALLGAATALRYYEHAFLGPVLLREGPDAAGLTVAILAHLVESLQRDGIHVVDAEATSSEEAILARMGFTLLRRTVILERSAPPVAAASPPPPETLVMERRHLLDVGSLDADAVGYGRKDYLLALRQELSEGARVMERDGDVVGFAFLRRTPRGFQVGPIVTREDDAAAARTLARDAALAAGEASVTVLVPDQSALVPMLVTDGFTRVGVLARMRAAARPAPSEGAGAYEWALGGRMTG